MPYQLPNGLYPYPLNFLASDGGINPEVFVPGDPTVEPDSTNWYVLCLTPEELIDVMSLVEVGAPIAFPDDWGRISQKFWQMREFPNSFGVNTCVDICQMIIDCIESNQDVRDAIIGITNTTTEEGITNVAQMNDGLLLDAGENPECDADSWWSACLQTVQRMNRVNEDALEILEVNTNIWDFCAQIIGNITVIDETSLDAIGSWIEYLIDNIAENYAAQYTTAYEEEVACDLFCLALDACELTPNMIIDYFSTRMGGSIEFQTTLPQALEFLFTGVWTGTQIADFMFVSQLAFRDNFNKFFSGIAYNDISVAVQLGFLDPSDGWIALCDDCPTFWTFDSDFDNSQCGFVPEVFNGNNAATWAMGDGWESTDIQSGGSSWGRYCAIDIEFADPVTITQIQLNHDIIKGNYISSSNPAIIIQGRLGGPTGTVVINEQVSNGSISNCTDCGTAWSGEEEVDWIMLYVRSSNQSIPTYTGLAKINSVHIEGTGTQPPELSC